MNTINHRARRGGVMGLCFLLVLCAARVQADPQVGDSGDYSNLERTIGSGETVDQQPFYVGDGGTNNYLLITDTGDLRTWGDLYIGHLGGSDHNEMLVTGQDSTATNRYVFIGNAGSHNTLRIENEAFMFTEHFGRIGATSNAHYNTVIVDNATWQNARLTVGQALLEPNSHNLLVITNGGVVQTINTGGGGGYAQIGWGRDAAAWSNRAVVTGTDSAWIITNYLVIGHTTHAQYNSVRVEDGGRIEVGNYLNVGGAGSHNRMELEDAQVEIGDGLRIGTSSTSHSNRLQVVDSTLDVGGQLQVGREGRYNHMSLSDEGVVKVVSNIQVGALSASSHNELLVDGTGTHLSSEAGLQVGFFSDHNRMELTGGATYSNLYPTSVYGVTIFDQVGYGGDHNELLVRGTGTYWYAGNRFYVGMNNGEGNRVLLSEGARMDVGGYGVQIYGNNEITVSTNAVLGVAQAVFLHGGDGDGSILRIDSGGVLTNTAGTHAFFMRENSQFLLHGSETRGYWSHQIQTGQQEGNTNTLVAVSGGAELRVGGRITVGLQTNASDNRVEVSGDGSLLHAEDRLYIGESVAGENNRVWVNDSGRVVVAGHSLQVFGGNEMVVSTNAVLDVAERVYLRSGIGAGGILRIDTGGVLTNTAGGTFFTRDNAQLLLDGSATRGYWSGDFRMGELEGNTNSLVAVSGGAQLRVGDMITLAYGTDTSGHRIDVSGDGSLLHTDDRIRMGNTVDDGENRITVTGDGAQLTTGYGTTIGYYSDHNRMELSGGAYYEHTDASEGSGGGAADHDFLGYGGNYNEILVTGPGTVWNAGNRFRIGEAGGSFNTLVISNQAQLLISGGFVNRMAGESNIVLVTDGGLFDYREMGIGYATDGVGNAIQVRNGGILTNSHSGSMIVGRATGSRDNELLLSGTQTRGYLRDVAVGYDAAEENRMTVEEGAQAYVERLRVNWDDGAVSNRVLVTGPGSRLEASGELVVGRGGSHGLMTVSNGATVRTHDSVIIGEQATAAHNQVLLTGAGSAWTNTGGFFVGNGGAVGNMLQVHEQALLESDTLEVGAGGILELSNATIYVEAGSNPFVVHEGGMLRGSGRIETDVFMGPDPVFIDGTVSPGFSTGTLEFDGHLTLGENAVVVMEIAGGDDFDQIILDAWGEGVLTFNGTLQLSLLNDYEPQLHDSFQLFTAYSYLDIEKMLIDDDNAQLQEGWSWQLNNDGSVSVIPEAATAGTMLLGLTLLAARRRCRM